MAHEAGRGRLAGALAPGIPAPLLDVDLATARGFATAILIGGLLGIERERRNTVAGTGAAGLRSFVLLSITGAVGGHLAVSLVMPWVLPTAVLAAVAIVAISYLQAQRASPSGFDLRTALAAIVTTLLGALATTGNWTLAAGLGVLTTALLAYKQPLHGFVGRLHTEELLIALRFLLATFLVLPLLPDRAIDPWGAINPFELWLLVLLISGISLAGYVLTRWLGPGRGIALTAATAGLVSSTAVTLTFARQSRVGGEGTPRQYAAGMLLAWGVMFARMLVTATVLQPALLAPLALPFGAMGGTAIAVAVCWFASARRHGDATSGQHGTGREVGLRNPFSLLAATRFALLFAAVLLLLAIVREHLPAGGVYAVAALAGLTDVDAITLSMAAHARDDPAVLPIAVHAIAIAAVANTAVKTTYALALGARALRLPVALGAAAVVAAGACTMLW